MTTRGFTSETASALLDKMVAATDKDRAAIARLLLYSTHDRPSERAEQKKLFLGMVERDIALAPSDWLNARAAAAHKCLELQDVDAIVWLLPHLEEALQKSRDLPWRGSIRENRVHVGYSVSYVLLLASLYDGAGRFDHAASDIMAFTKTLPRDQLGRGFFRSSANLTKCLGLIAVRQARSARISAAHEASELIRAALQTAVEVRDLRDSVFPLSRYLPARRLAGAGPLASLKRSNEFKENMRAHRILAAVQDLSDAEAPFSCGKSAQAVTLELSVSDAYPGQKEAAIEAFDDLFPALDE